VSLEVSAGSLQHLRRREAGVRWDVDSARFEVGERSGQQLLVDGVAAFVVMRQPRQLPHLLGIGDLAVQDLRVDDGERPQGGQGSDGEDVGAGHAGHVDEGEAAVLGLAAEAVVDLDALARLVGAGLDLEGDELEGGAAHLALLDQLAGVVVEDSADDLELRREVDALRQADVRSALDAAELGQVVLEGECAVLLVPGPPVAQERLDRDDRAVPVDDRVVAGEEVDGVASAGAEGQFSGA